MYYRNQWVEVSFPEPYEFGEGASIAWLADDSDKKPLVYQQAALPTREEIEEGLEVKDEDDFLQPSMAFLPDGYIEPEGVIELNYESNEISYSYNWDSEELRIKMEKNKK